MAVQTNTPTVSSDTPHLKRELRLIDLIMASMGGVIGSGWLFGSLAAANTAGPAAIWSWIIGGGAVLLIGLVYSELGAMIPQSGGVVRFPQFSHGSLVSFITGWAYWIGAICTPGIEAEAVVQYSNHWIHGLMVKGILSTTGIIAAAVLVLIFFGINTMGIRLFALVNTNVTWVKFIVPSLTAIVLLAAGMHGANFTAHGFAPSGNGAVLSAIATSGVLFSYLGFRQAIDLAGEAKNPQRDIPLAILITVGISIVLYIGLQVAFIGAVSPSQLAHGWAKLSLSSPFADVALGVGATWLAVILFADAILSPGGTGLISTASASRIAFALGQNGYFPKKFMALSKTGVPIYALVTDLILGLLVLLPFPSWSLLVSVISTAGIITYMAGPVALISMRRTMPDTKRPMILKGAHIIAPVAYVIASLIVYWAGWPLTGQVILALIVGLPIYYMHFKKNQVNPAHVKAAMWMIANIVGIGILSYFGTFGGSKLIPSPVDSIVVAVISIVCFYWGVSSGLTPEEIGEVAHLEY